jgi:flagellar biosynthesis/type III secretory pathway chaperone
MTPYAPSPRDLIGQLLELLDEEVRILDLRQEQLSHLSTCLASRDQQKTERLLDEIEQTQTMQQQIDARLAENRALLARMLQWERGDLKLSALIDALPGAVGIAIAEKRQRIIELAEKVKHENLRASMILAECAHLNQLMLQAFLPSASQVTTYGNGGSATWRGAAGLVDARG